MQKITFNEQKLLFDKTNKIKVSKSLGTIIPKSFYQSGYGIIDGIQNPQEAYAILEKFISQIDLRKLPLFSQFVSRIQLAKADLIPVCNDVVESSFQVLHLDMGQPIISDISQTMYLLTGLYAPINKKGGTAKTRILPLKGFFKDSKWGSSSEIENKLIDYVEKYGDGWADVNTKRLSCFARVLDAVSETTDVATYRDKTVGQWFQNDTKLDTEESLKNEQSFYSRKGINLNLLETHIQLKPGQLLFFDNTRVTHGRLGKRKAKEVYQFLFGVKDATVQDITAFRKFFVKELKKK